VADAAIMALGVGRFVDAVSVLVGILAGGETGRRTQAVRALAASMQPGTVELLREAALDANADVSAAGFSGLAMLNTSESASAIWETAAEPLRRETCIRQLSQCSPAVSILAQGLLQANVDVRRTAIEILSRVHATPAIEAIRTALDDPHPAVRFAARYALSRRHPMLSTTTPGVGSEGDP
jgi:HEAT repeat protein